jgi:cell division protein FtsW
VVMFLLVSMSDYRMQRVMSFRDPWADPFDTGFQLTQALIAIGRGEIFGVGLGASIQKLYYLPHANNDFILAVIGEELGLLGIVLVIVLFALLLHRALVIARAAELVGKIYAARLAQGIGFLLVFQAAINIGVNLGVLPTKGLNLPFISYGGSSMLVCCAAMGMLFAVDRQTRTRTAMDRAGRGINA